MRAFFSRMLASLGLMAFAAVAGGATWYGVRWWVLGTSSPFLKDPEQYADRAGIGLGIAVGVTLFVVVGAIVNRDVP